MRKTQHPGWCVLNSLALERHAHIARNLLLHDDESQRVAKSVTLLTELE